MNDFLDVHATCPDLEGSNTWTDRSRTCRLDRVQELSEYAWLILGLFCSQS